MNNYEQLYLNFINHLEFSGSLGGLIKRMVNSGGSHLRPQLVLAWCDYYGGNINMALPAALAVELIHMASLIQDDLPCMDNCRIRRGKAALHIYAGESGAILCSDSLMALGFELLAKSDFSPQEKIEMIRIFSDTILLMGDGQYKELVGNDTTKTDWAEVHMKKTGALMSCACRLGARAAGENDETASNFGLYLGFAFQIKDDLKDKDGICFSWSEEEIQEAIEICNYNLALEPKNSASEFLIEVVKKVMA